MLHIWYDNCFIKEMAYKKDYYSGFKFSINRKSGFFRRLGITQDYRIAPLCEAENIRYFILFYSTVLDFYGTRFHGSLDLISKADIEKLKYIYFMQTSESVKRKSPNNNVPDILKIFGLQWHWWCEKYGINEGGIASDIIAVNTWGKCLQILKEDRLDMLLMYYNMFHDDFLSEGLYFPHLKTMLDDLAQIISVRSILANKNLFCGSSSSCRKILGENLSLISF
jgi:hypothetical protein